MAAGQNVIVIDVQAKFTDQMTPGMEKAKKSAEQCFEAIDKLKRQMNQLGGKKAAPEIGLKDKATAALKNIWKDMRGLAGKTIQFVMSIAGGLAGQKLIAGPIALADRLKTAGMSLEKMTGSAARAAALMKQLKAFSLKTPFDTSGAASTAKQMLGAGWTAGNVVEDMTKIGNTAAAGGRGAAGVQGTIQAMKQMRESGKAGSKEMNQLADLGIRSWEYVAKSMKKTVPQVRKLSRDGLLPAETAIQGILDGMGEYDGVMEKLSNQTVKGLVSNLKEVFDLNIVEKWGRGLSEGAGDGLGKLIAWLGQIEPLLEKAGLGLSSLGKKISKGFFQIVGGITDRITEVLQSDDFLDAPSVLGKVKVIWDKVIGDPFSKWIGEKAGSFGAMLGTGLSDGIKTLLGINLTGNGGGGASVGASFAEGFLDGFDGAAIGKRLKEILKGALSEALKILPGGESPTSLSWISAGALAYGGAKLLKPVHTLGKGIGSATKAFTGKSLIPAVLGTPASGKGLLGRAAMAAINMGSGNLSSGASMSAGALSAVGGLAVGGGVAGGAALLSGISDLAKAMRTNDATLKKSYMAKSNYKIGGVTAGAGIGAAIGSLFGGIGAVPGALIGAGIGGVTGWIKGNKKAEAIEEEARIKKREEAVKNLKFSTEEMNKTIQDTSLSAEELQKAFEKACSRDLRNHFGDIVLTMEEIQKLSRSIVYGDGLEKFTKFSAASDQTGNAQAQYQSGKADLEKENWKAGLGLKLDKESQADLLEAADAFAANADTVLETRHYQAHLALNLLLEPEQSEPIEKQLDKYYETTQTELDKNRRDLKISYQTALKNDGVITPDEAEEINKIRDKISEIVEKGSQDTYETKMDVIKVKYSGGSLNLENYQEFQNELMAGAQEKSKRLDESLEISIRNLKMIYPEGSKEYKEAFDALTQNYHIEQDKIFVDVAGFQVNTIADNYSKELDGILPDIQGTTEEKLMSGVRNAVASGALGKNPVDWDDKAIAAWFGLDKLPEEAKKNVTGMIKLLAMGIPEEVRNGMEADDNLEKFRDQYGSLSLLSKVPPESMIIAANLAYQGVPSEVRPMLTAPLISMHPEFQLTDEKTPEELISQALLPFQLMSAQSSLELNISDNSAEAAKTTKEAVNTSFDHEFSGGIEKTVDVKLTMNPNIINPKQNFICTGTVSYAMPETPAEKGRGSDAYTPQNGHPVKNAAGGFITGGRQLSWLDEENKGEVIIPFNPARRARALSLYEETGRRLGVLNHADGGFVGRAMSGADLKADQNRQKSSDALKERVTVQIAGINFELKTDGNGQSLLDMIESQRDEISSKISEILAEAFEDGFTNLPMAASRAG